MTQPSDIFICVNNKAQTTLFPFKYYIYNQEITIQTPEQIILSLQQPNSQTSHQMKLFGKIPLRTDLINSFEKLDTQQFFLSHQILNNTQFISDIFKEDDQLSIQLIMLSQIQEDVFYKQIIQNQTNLDILNHCLIMQYFPFTLLVGSQNIFKQDRLEFYKYETLQIEQTNKYVKDHKNIFQKIKCKYFVNFIKYAIQLRDVKMDLKTLFNEIELKNFMNLQVLQYFYINNEEKFVVTKQQQFQDQIPIHQFYTEELNGYSDQFYFKITEFGYLEFVLYIKDSFNIYPIQQEGKWLEKFQNFVQLINNFKYQFSLDNIDINQSELSKYIDVIIYLFGLENVNLTQISIEQSLQKNNVLFLPLKNKNIWKSYMLFNQGFTFSLRTEGDQLQIQYNGKHHQYVDIFTQILISNQKEEKQMMETNLTDEQLTKQLIKNDPKLFTNLKNIQYSRVCQGNKKPINVNNDTQPNTYKYWNFTTNKQQYYKCPNNHKYLYFRIGHHQDGYCLPCCSNVNPQKTVAKRKKYEQCLEHGVVNEVDKDPTKYAFRNADNFQIGRLTIIDKDTLNMVYKSKYQDDYFVYCLKLPQNLSNIRDIIQTFILSISYLLGITDYKLLENLHNFFKQHNNQEMIESIQNYQQNTLIYSYSFEQWFVYISQYIQQNYQYNLFLIKRQAQHTQEQQAINNYKIQIQTIDASDDKNIFVIQIYETINPIVTMYGQQIQKTINSEKLKITQMVEQEKRKQFLFTVSNIYRNLQNKKQLNKHYTIKNQIVNQEGFCIYVTLENDNKQQILLPTDESIPINKIKTTQQIMKLNTYTNSELNVLELLELYEIFDTNEQQKSERSLKHDLQKQQFGDIQLVKDSKSNELCGFMFKDLFFLINIFQKKSIFDNNNILTSPIQFNPVYINYLISTQTNDLFKTTQLQIHKQILKSVYINYLYKLLKMQYFAGSKQEKNMDELFVFLSIEEIYQIIEQYILSKKKVEDIQEIKQLSSCVKNPFQFFCQDQKMILPLQSQKYFELMKKEFQITSKKMFKQFLSLLISEFEFKKQPDEFIVITQLEKQKWKHK